MRAYEAFKAIAAICLATGCSTIPPKSQQVSHDPLLSRQGGVLLLVDACVQRDGLGDGDYFVIAESESGGQAALDATRKYLAASDIPLRAEIVAVCAARLNADRSSILVADRVGGKRRQSEQPLRLSGPDTEDSQYAQALAIVSTYAFERAAVQRDGKQGNKENKVAATAVNGADFRAAAETLKSKTRASSVLFLGALGTSRSGGKAAAQFLGSFAVGMGTAIATAGLGTGYYLAFIPGRQIEGVLMEGALIDLETGELTWSNAVRAGGDPVETKVMSNSETLNLLFRGIVFKPAN